MAGYYWPVVVDLEGTTVGSQNRPILYSHDAAQIVGHSEKISLMAQTIKVSGKSVALRNINSRDQLDKQIWVQSCELRGGEFGCRALIHGSSKGINYRKANGKTPF